MEKVNKIKFILISIIFQFKRHIYFAFANSPTRNATLNPWNKETLNEVIKTQEGLISNREGEQGYRD